MKTVTLFALIVAATSAYYLQAAEHNDPNNQFTQAMANAAMQQLMHAMQNLQPHAAHNQAVEDQFMQAAADAAMQNAMQNVQHNLHAGEQGQMTNAQLLAQARDEAMRGIAAAHMSPANRTLTGCLLQGNT